MRQAKLGKNIQSSFSILKPINKTLTKRWNDSLKLKESIENGMFCKSKKREIQKKRQSFYKYESKIQSSIVLNYILNEAFNRISLKENNKSVRQIKNLFISKCSCLTCRNSCEVDEYVSCGLCKECFDILSQSE